MQSDDNPPQKSASGKRPLCVLNGAAGSHSADARRDEISRAFASRGQPVEVIVSPNVPALEERAREAVANGARLLIAGGGDGTVSAVANALVGSHTALAVLPLGTLNHFAKDMGIPLDIDAAIANAFEGQMRVIDAGEVNGRVFVNNSSIGLYPAVVRAREDLQHDGRGKWIALAQAFFAILKRPAAMRIRLASAECTLTAKTEFVFIGNNLYDLAPPRIGGRNSVEEGVLWVCRLPHTGRFRALLAAMRALIAPPQSRTPLAFTTKELSIGLRRRRTDVALDGEVIEMETPLQYRIRPGALRVIVPGPAP